MSSASFAGVVGRNSINAMASKSYQYKSRHRWVVLYWMPYNNNLSSFGEPIIKMLALGTKDSEAVVVVQSHYFGDSKMRRRIFINNVIREMDITAKDSSNISAFSTYLDWAYQTFEAEHWVVIVVGHGGKVNEISPDDHVSTDKIRTWMRVDQFAKVVSSFNQATNNRVELLFFQNCNKASLEVVYEARNCARYTLASQLTLGAPNYYYGGFLKRLKEPSLKGREAAIAIMESERPDMYYTLTLVDNRAIENFIHKLSRLVQILQSVHSRAVDLSNFSTLNYSGERYCDVLKLFKYLSKNINQADTFFTEFADFLNSSVITYYKTGGKLYGSNHFSNNDSEKLCGLSMYLPETRQVISRYSSLALYQNVALVSLYRGILTS
ncbi:MAG: clostripain-related cysteine peptidase [Rhizonema sp. PD38]|nr:clostripain-related cysteine peptidase [Rhizonema sp. PD38]